MHDQRANESSSGGLCQHVGVEQGPKFIRFFWPILASLREFGGAAPAAEVVDRASEMLQISDDERAERTKGGTLRVVNQAHWARRYLVWAGSTWTDRCEGGGR
jgi:restriction endonuclease Mrr